MQRGPGKRRPAGAEKRLGIGIGERDKPASVDQDDGMPDIVQCDGRKAWFCLPRLHYAAKSPRQSGSCPKSNASRSMRSTSAGSVPVMICRR